MAVTQLSAKAEQGMVGGAVAAHVNFQIAARVCVQTNNLLRLSENDVLEKLQVLTLGGLSVM